MMPNQTIVYGDSFSNYKYISDLSPISQNQMWFNYVATGKIIDRTKPGQSPFTMFLQATHDVISHKEPTRLILALGACTRLPTYIDGWYKDEQLKDIDPTTPLPDPARPTNLTDCEPYFNHAEVNKHNMDQLHPTLLWATIYKEIINLSQLCQTHQHQLIIVHMNADSKNGWIHKKHPLIKPLCECAENLPNYFTEQESCKAVCEQANIKPLDFNVYKWNGHHGLEAQQFFGRYISNKTVEKQLWN